MLDSIMYKMSYYRFGELRVFLFFKFFMVELCYKIPPELDIP